MEANELETFILESVRTDKHCFRVGLKRILRNLQSPLANSIDETLKKMVVEELISISKFTQHLKVTEKGVRLIESTPIPENIKVIIANVDKIYRFDNLQALTIIIPFLIIPALTFMVGALVGNTEFFDYYPVLTIGILSVAIAFFLVMYRMAKKELPIIKGIIDKINMG